MTFLQIPMQTTNGSEDLRPSIYLPSRTSEQDMSADASYVPFRRQNMDREETDYKLSNYIKSLNHLTQDSGLNPFPNGNQIASSVHNQNERDYQSKVLDMMLIVDPKTNTSMELVLASVECRYSQQMFAYL